MTKENLTIVIKNPNTDTVVVELGGVADVSSMHLIRKALGLHNLTAERIILDIAALEHMSSMVIGYFLMLASELQGKGGDLKIQNANTNVSKAVRALGIPGLLKEP